jgi:ATP-dependent RNA helicase DeaD
MSVAFPSHPALARALAERMYLDPTPVQAAVLAPEAADCDLLVSAQTGSGKTVAYGLALAATLLGEAEGMGPAAAPLALVVAPTRELALQVHRELTWLYRPAAARVVACVGGMDPRREQRQLSEGAHIVVGTPGRLRDHLGRRALDLSALRAVVLDEADEMLDLGFREELEILLDAAPRDRRSLLFSATLPADIVALARRYQRNALRIEVSGAGQGHADIEYRAIRIMPGEVEHAVVNLLRLHEAPGALVFCNTREAVRHLQAMLSERGFAAVALSGELSQSERNQALQALRDGRARVCVATDVAARGIDLRDLGLVIHADLPHDAEVMQHRSGRTGRAGRKGVSVLLVPGARRRRAEELLAAAGVEVAWSGPPMAEEIRRLDQERLLQDPLLAEEPGEEDLAAAQRLLASRPAEAIAAALARLYRSRLPAPEDVRDPGDGFSRQNRAGREARDRRSGPPRGREVARNGAPPAGPPDRSRGPKGSGVWFRLDLGRRNNADPRWLLPMICRRGNVTRADIGAIRIFERETKFEVAAPAAAGFASAIQHAAGGGEGRIEALTEQRGAVRDRAPEVHDRAPAKALRKPKRNDRPERKGKRRRERSGGAS